MLFTCPDSCVKAFFLPLLPSKFRHSGGTGAPEQWSKQSSCSPHCQTWGFLLQTHVYIKTLLLSLKPESNGAAEAAWVIVSTNLYVWQTEREREPRWMHSGLLHYWTSVWLFSFSAAIKTDDRHFEAVVAGGWAEKRKVKKRNAQKLFFNKKNTEWKWSWICSVKMLLLLTDKRDFNKGVIIPLCAEVSTKWR